MFSKNTISLVQVINVRMSILNVSEKRRGEEEEGSGTRGEEKNELRVEEKNERTAEERIRVEERIRGKEREKRR